MYLSVKVFGIEIETLYPKDMEEAESIIGQLIEQKIDYELKGGEIYVQKPQSDEKD